MIFLFNKDDGKKRNRRLRRERLKRARSKGTHSDEEWNDMKEFFDHTCVNCFGESGIDYVEKDHIIPLYQGGSDHIRNLQPLCAKCNSGKGNSREDLRGYLAKHLGKKLPDNYKNPY